MLMNVSLPAGAAAATSIARNEGEMVNKGFELSISSKIFVEEHLHGIQTSISLLTGIN